jgi:hypothetical protein
VEQALERALAAALAELVRAADCAEYSDATGNAAQYRRAAGHLEPAAGPDGLEALPPVTVRDLAAALGLADPAEVAGRLRAGEDDVIRHLRRQP